ncbi:MAG: sensor domain-containing diguanylate cyclase [Nitrospirota bacterium]
MTYIIPIAMIVVISAYITIAVRRHAKTAGIREGRILERKDKDETYFKEIVTRDQEIRNLQLKIDSLNDLNSQYLSFTFKVPNVIQRLNSTLKLEEIISSITHLAKDIIPAGAVDLYLFSPKNQILQKVSRESAAGNGTASSIALGEGLIGMAASDRIVRVNGRFQKGCAGSGTAECQGETWMAVPIIFKERLLGVIGIGKPEKPVGNESHLLKMIADIAAVALVNQAMLGEAKQKANTDPLTGISNRNYFFQMAQTFLEKAVRDNSDISIFLFDIDHFKHYNDNNGHDAGDRLLIELTGLVGGITRKNAVFARYGGEEFIVMLPGISKEDTLVYAERVREQIARHPFEHGEKQPLGCVSISGGIASFPIDGDTIFKVIQLADASLYEAKDRGRNSVLLHRPYHFSEESLASDKAVR